MFGWRHRNRCHVSEHVLLVLPQLNQPLLVGDELLLRLRLEVTRPGDPRLATLVTFHPGGVKRPADDDAGDRHRSYDHRR